MNLTGWNPFHCHAMSQANVSEFCNRSWPLLRCSCHVHPSSLTCPSRATAPEHVCTLPARTLAPSLPLLPPRAYTPIRHRLGCPPSSNLPRTPRLPPLATAPSSYSCDPPSHLPTLAGLHSRATPPFLYAALRKGTLPLSPSRCSFAPFRSLFS